MSPSGHRITRDSHKGDTVGIRIGFDVGERSVGCAAVEYDDDGWPIQVLAAVSHIHDGGMDPDTAQSPLSRLATAGVARRTRRLTRNRRKRLATLDTVLRDCGYSVPAEEVPQTYDAWHARARLATDYITHDTERGELLVLAVRHMARHRGWRNPWWTYPRLAEADVPSEAFQLLGEKARQQYGTNVASLDTLGQIVSSVAGTDVVVRPRTRGLVEQGHEPLMSTQIRQEDTLHELHRILRTQQVPEDHIERICQAVFWQAKPTVPLARIGRCALLPDEPRASLATMEFQEYRVRAAVANLRLHRNGTPLTAEQHDLVVTTLLGWRDPVRPRWKDVAEWLGVTMRSLAVPSIDHEGGTSVPVDRTSATIEATFAKKSQIGHWWRHAQPDERAELIAQITDLSGEDSESDLDTVADFQASWTTKTMEDIDKVSLESGRAAYSRRALQHLNAQMRDHRCDVHEARKRAFGVDDTWQPPRASFSDDIEHPAVRRVNTIVHRFLSTAITRWGLPDAVIVEHVRGAFMGPAALAELESEIRFNTRRREQTFDSLRQQGIEHPSRTDVLRLECIERQNSACLYCGTPIGLTTSELDHILAQSNGGGNRRDNLVAVCRPCNADKGKQPFATWATRSPRTGVSVDEVKERVRGWARGRLSTAQFSALKRDVVARLSMTDVDGEGDRSLESTAYAAREMRERIQTFLTDYTASNARNGESGSAPGREPQVEVYQGLVTSEARKAGGVDDMLQLRSFTRKSRLDRRHHAIDATVLTSLNAGVAKTLKERAELAAVNRTVKSQPEWKEYRGSSPGAIQTFTQWQERILVLAQRLKDDVDADRIAVMRPLRLSPRVGSVHADTITPLAHTHVGDAFSADELSRVVDNQLFLRLRDLADDAGELDVDPNRAHLLDLPTHADIALYPTTAAYLPVRGGAVAIGGTVQSARVYAWPGRRGYDYGMVRLYTGEFAHLGFLTPGCDIMTAPLPDWSQAMRTANPRLRDRIATGEAKQIGWLTLGDEIEIDVPALAVGDSKMAQFLQASPDKRWVITGFFDLGRISLAPSQLAYEGVDDHTPEAVATVLKANRIPLSINVVLGGDRVAIIRRTVLGRPRWNHAHLACSWTPMEQADQAFGR